MRHVLPDRCERPLPAAFATGKWFPYTRRSLTQNSGWGFRSTTLDMSPTVASFGRRHPVTSVVAGSLFHVAIIVGLRSIVELMKSNIRHYQIWSLMDHIESSRWYRNRSMNDWIQQLVFFWREVSFKQLTLFLISCHSADILRWSKKLSSNLNDVFQYRGLTIFFELGYCITTSIR